MNLSFFNGTIIGFILSLNDLVSFSMTKNLFLNKSKFNLYQLIFPSLLYSFQIPLFFYGLKTTSMSILNITWNLFSNILVTFIGIFVYNESLNGLKTLAMIFAFTSIFLFAIDQYVK